MSAQAFQSILDKLGDHYGALDNQVERWADQQYGLARLFPEIEQALQNNFPPGSAPLTIFAQGQHTYNSLMTDLSGTPAAYLNLRFFILLNAFLQACQESLQKAALNPALDPSALVERSYYSPYFFDRVTVSRQEMIQILQDEIAELQTAARDRSGILLALRSRKGVVSTLAESYCPTHPVLYPLVQELDAVKVSNDPGVVDAVLAKLEAILAAV